MCFTTVSSTKEGSRDGSPPTFCRRMFPRSWGRGLGERGDAHLRPDAKINLSLFFSHPLPPLESLLQQIKCTVKDEVDLFCKNCVYFYTLVHYGWSEDKTPKGVSVIIINKKIKIKWIDAVIVKKKKRYHMTDFLWRLLFSERWELSAEGGRAFVMPVLVDFSQEVNIKLKKS